MPNGSLGIGSAAGLAQAAGSGSPSTPSPVTSWSSGIIVKLNGNDSHLLALNETKLDFVDGQVNNFEPTTAFYNQALITSSAVAVAFGTLKLVSGVETPDRYFLRVLVPFSTAPNLGLTVKDNAGTTLLLNMNAQAADFVLNPVTHLYELVAQYICG